MPSAARQRKPARIARLRWRFRSIAVAQEMCYHLRKWCAPEKVARCRERVTVRIVDSCKLQEAIDLGRVFEGKRF